MHTIYWDYSAKRLAASKSVSAFIRHFVVSRPFIAQIEDQPKRVQRFYILDHITYKCLVPLGLPPVQEQIEIASHLGDELLVGVEVEEQIETSISKTEKYRSTLITAAITGQIEGLQ